MIAIAQAALGAVQQASLSDGSIGRGELQLVAEGRWSERYNGMLSTPDRSIPQRGYRFGVPIDSCEEADRREDAQAVTTSARSGRWPRKGAWG